MLWMIQFIENWIWKKTIYFLAKEEFLFIYKRKRGFWKYSSVSTQVNTIKLK